MLKRKLATNEQWQHAPAILRSETYHTGIRPRFPFPSPLSPLPSPLSPLSLRTLESTLDRQNPSPRHANACVRVPWTLPPSSPGPTAPPTTTTTGIDASSGPLSALRRPSFAAATHDRPVSPSCGSPRKQAHPLTPKPGGQPANKRRGRQPSKQPLIRRGRCHTAIARPQAAQMQAAAAATASRFIGAFLLRKRVWAGTGRGIYGRYGWVVWKVWVDGMYGWVDCMYGWVDCMYGWVDCMYGLYVSSLQCLRALPSWFYCRASESIKLVFHLKKKTFQG